jgi:hypothetical protein
MIRMDKVQICDIRMKSVRRRRAKYLYENTIRTRQFVVLH